MCLESIVELTISDSVSKVGVFQPDGNKSVENLASNYRLWWFSVIRQIEVENGKTSNVRVMSSYSNAAQSEQSTEQPAKHCEEGD